MPLYDPKPTTSCEIHRLLVSLRRDGFDLDFNTRTGELIDDQKRGRWI
jgi:hypothetical protein